MIIAEEVIRRRKALGLSQKGLSAKSGIAQQTISLIERKLTKETTSIGRLAAALDCDPETLDPDFRTRPPEGQDLGEVASGMTDDIVVLLDRVATHLAKQLGFRPTRMQVVAHLLTKAGYISLLKEPLTVTVDQTPSTD